MSIFSRFFKKKECQHEWQMEKPTMYLDFNDKLKWNPLKDICTKCGATRPHVKCQHDWQLEQPTMDFGDALKVWDDPVYDVCTKCGARRPHPECDHEWQPAEDDGNGITVNDTKTIRTAICSKCGAELYEKPK